MFIKYRIQRRNKKLLKTVRFPKKGKLLDLSTGDGSFLESLQAISPDLELYSIDLNKPEVLSPDISFEIADASSLPFDERSFDYIICSMSLHHYEKPNLAFKEMDRVLRKNGTIYLTDIIPTNNLFKWIYNVVGCGGPYHFESYYTDSDILKLLNSFRLQVLNKYQISNFVRVETLELQKRI